MTTIIPWILLIILCVLINVIPIFRSNQDKSIWYKIGLSIVPSFVTIFIVLTVMRVVLWVGGAIIYPLISKSLNFYKEQRVSKRLFLYQSKFNALKKKHERAFNVIEGEHQSGLGINYIKMDNEEKYYYYTKETTELKLEEINKKVNNLDNIIDSNMISALEEYCSLTKYSVRDVLDKYKFGEIQQLIEYIKIVSDDYKNTYDKYMGDKIGTSIGKRGEDSVNDNLKMYDHKLINLSNIRFEVNGNSIETDNLVLSQNGIYSLEVKNLGSTGKFSIRIDRDGRWSKVIRQGSYEKVEPMNNVTDQTYRHLAYTEKLFNEELKKRSINEEITVIPLIVFANDKVEIENNSDMKIIRTSNIYMEVSKGQSNYSKELLEVLKEISLENNLPPKKFPTIDITDKLKFMDKFFDEVAIAFDDYNDLMKELTESK